jgi:fatty-acyl-CoA synthase
MTGFGDHVRARAHDQRIGLRFEDQPALTYAEWVQECSDRAALWNSLRRPGAPHIGVLLENVPDFTMWLGAAALTGATVVGVNPTRRGAELARDILHTECQLIVTEQRLLGLLDDVEPAIARDRILVVDHPEFDAILTSHRGAAVPTDDIDPGTQLLLLFTSGTSGAPKAVICTHRRLEHVARSMIALVELTADDVTYTAMPLFHSNSLFCAWAPSVVAGACLALRRTFSASEFLPDVRRFGATYFNYVGTPLAYVLATPERPDDADNPLIRGFGNEAGHADLARFTARFGCSLRDGYGQTEMGASISQVPGMPDGALGMGAPSVKVLDPATGEECPPARFDDAGCLLNAEEATGEIVNTQAVAFEGYWNNPEADVERMRRGAYWTGDLAYRDVDGFFYFAGRSADWLRVDGENFASAPVERIIARAPGVVLASAYGVPDPHAGDRLMVTLQLDPATEFDPVAFGEFCATQPDLGPKWVPTFVRIAPEVPMTRTNKVLTRELALERWHTADPVWWRPDRSTGFERFTADARAAWDARFDPTKDGLS